MSWQRENGRSNVPPSPRRTRQWAKQKASQDDAGSSNVELGTPGLSASTNPVHLSTGITRPAVKTIPGPVPPSYPGLNREDHAGIMRKQKLLATDNPTIPRDFQKYSGAVDATLVFGQAEAGTAVCISPAGLLLTCAHCVAETRADLDMRKTHWLVFSNGRIVSARCIAWDERRDLALLRITAAQAGQRAPDTTEQSTHAFSWVPLAEHQVALDARLVCVGHPGSEDLEADEPGVMTNYEVLHLSTGQFKGYASEQDLQDNSEIGALMHNCWTYWGHSGAPLLGRRNGKLVGLHSSWDDTTGMRRGVALEAIRSFVEEHRGKLSGEETMTLAPAPSMPRDY